MYCRAMPQISLPHHAVAIDDTRSKRGNSPEIDLREQVAAFWGSARVRPGRGTKSEVPFERMINFLPLDKLVRWVMARNQ